MALRLLKPKATDRKTVHAPEDERDGKAALGAVKLRPRAFFKLAGASVGLGLASQVALPPKAALADQVAQMPLVGPANTIFTLQSDAATGAGAHAFDFTLLPGGGGTLAALLNIRTNGFLDLNNHGIVNLSALPPTTMNGTLDLGGYSLLNAGTISPVANQLLTLGGDTTLASHVLKFNSSTSSWDTLQGNVSDAGARAGASPGVFLLESYFDDLVLQAGADDNNPRALTLRVGLGASNKLAVLDILGNVGIGTTSPGAKLDVAGLIAASGSALITSAPPTVSQQVGWKIGLWGNQYALGVADATVAIATNQWLSLFAAATSPANDGTTTTPDSKAKVTLGADGSGRFLGSVGIGTTSPSYPLDVNGVAGTSWGEGALRLTNASGDVGLHLNAGSGGHDFLIASTGPSSPLGSAAGALVVGDASAQAARLVIDQNGNVGVGTTSPSGGGSGLTITGPTYANGVLYANASVIPDQGGTNAGSLTPGLLFGGGTSGEGISSKRSSGGNLNGLDFYTDFLNRMSITNSGSVGIGASGPSARLSVVAAGASEIGGAAMSQVWRSSAGTLGTAAPSELGLASVGFQTGANSVAFGVRAYSGSGASGWANAALALGMDVDATARAGPSLWLSGNGYVGIAGPLSGAGFTPQAALHLNSGAFQIGATKIADSSGSYYA